MGRLRLISLLFITILMKNLHALEDVRLLIVPNQPTTINDCHIRYHRYALSGIDDISFGKQVHLREFAHMAAIGWSQKNGTTVWNCGGSLILENYVLTAAHCAADADNTEPDVTRFGDLNLFDDGDNEYAQQRKIVEIIRHPDHKFSARYDDIALMRLEKGVTLHDTVAPACLWNEDEIRFKSLEAAGWGDTGFGEKRSPVLLKVSLNPVDPARCSNHFLHTRGFQKGLHANQLCVGDEKMDTCRGDSGGPLQVKLLHNTRVTPFVVGVTSFGAACGLSAPGVYTRVAPYIPWIRSVLNDREETLTEWMFQPAACALRYVQYRSFEPAVLKGDDNSHQSLMIGNAQLSKPVLKSQVSIHWNVTFPTHESQCYGIIVDERWVVTLARCTEIDGVPPSHIRYGGNKTNSVAEYFRHPRYETNSPYNEIGLLKLRERVTFGGFFVPACLRDTDGTPIFKMETAGRGLRNLIERGIGAIAEAPNETIDVNAVAYEQHGSNCYLSHDYTSQLEKGLTDEHLCFGSEPFLVPGTCHQTLGGPIQSVRYFWDRMLPDVYALNLFGRDCGYGESAVGVKVAYHTEWIQSILLPQKDVPENDERVIFLNEALEEGDRCVAERGSDGTCVDASYCPKVLYEWEVGGLVQFCQTGSLVCCPNGFVRNVTNVELWEIDECFSISTFFYKENPVVSIVWNTEVGVKSCVGTIVTSRSIVVAANCVIGMHSPVNLTIEETFGLGFKSLAVEKVIIHHEFNNSTKQHNIALIKMKDRLDEQLGKGPACLWTNSTHTPFYLTQTLRDTSVTDHTEAFPRYSVDCEHTFGRVLQPNELCLDMELRNGKLVVDEDMPALWNNKVGGGSSIPFLVGIASHKSRDDGSVFLHTRISSYVSWIKSVL